jgi:sec-independent protein translocase protein TatB
MFPEGRIVDFLIVGVVALIVVGPKDLPILMRRVGQFMAKMRGMAAEFRASFDEMARQSELDELRKEVDALRSGATSSVGLGAVGLGADSGAHKVFDEINSGMRGEEPQMRPLADYQYPARATPADPPARDATVQAEPVVDDPALSTAAKATP